MAEGLLKIKNKKVEGGGILREKGRGGETHHEPLYICIWRDSTDTKISARLV